MAHTRASNVLRSRSSNIFLVSSVVATARKAWWFVSVSPAKLMFFEKDCKSHAIDLADYGVILRSGYGDSPKEEDLEFMRCQWGWSQ